MLTCLVRIAGFDSLPLKANKFYDEVTKKLSLSFEGDDISQNVFKDIGRAADIELFESLVSLGKFELLLGEKNSFCLQRDLTENEIP